VISSSSIIGKNCKIKSGSIIGESGFGLVTDKDKKHHEIPHIGKVIIKDNVLIGGNCTIDKGTIDDTIIGNGTKFDNLVHIGHNVIIGDNCLICAQVGIGGSTKIDNHVIIGGQTGIIDNLLINENVIIGPKSYVIKSIEANTYVSGNPARNHRDHVKQDILISKLPEIYKKITK
jgi:UDP-3-O-[3-hydroxymyristoyl] glucosamine N-acyltransferase